ncbi:MAG: bacterioferritin [Burkholderiales bacterium]|jgi:bacterioferritin|nr:bacterioferritin [Burkholderiales bacterium]
MNSTIIELLNRILEQEHACAIRYATHAAVVSGPYSESVKARLKEIAQDEIMHAEKLRDRITALGGTPSMQVSVADLKHATSLSEILEINIAEEKEALRAYEELFRLIPVANVILYQTVQELIRDEQEHLEELMGLQSN